MKPCSWGRRKKHLLVLAVFLLPVFFALQFPFSGFAFAETRQAHGVQSGQKTAPQTRHILVITAQPYLTDWFNTLNQSLRDKLLSSLSASSKLSYEYIGSESLTDADYDMKLMAMMKEKYTHIQLDMVIAVLPVSNQFVLDHGESLFPGIAAVFVLPSKRQITQIKARPNSGLVKSSPDAIPETIKRIRTLLPGAEHLVVVSGSGADDLNYQSVAQEALKNGQWPKSMEILEGLPAEDLAVRLEKLPAQSAVLMLTYLQDREGKPLTTVQVMKAVSGRSAAPIFSFYDTVLGLGIVGGKLTSAEAYGEAVAETALKIFQNVRPLPLVEKVAEARDIYDGRQLEKWKISAVRLPDKSEIRYRKVTFWEEHRGKIVLASCVIILEALLILALVTNLLRRKHDELELTRYRNHLEELVRERTAELEIAKTKAESADRLKSSFLATMSHELRTPLNSIIGFTGILLQHLGGPLNEEQDKQLKMVYNSARHLLELINDVLDISKIEAEQLNVCCEIFNLRDSVEKVIKSSQPLADKKGIELSMSMTPDIGKIKSDRRRVEQILLNLLSNAIKFTEQGFVRLDGKILENKIVISVQDSGIGIKQEDMDKLFNAFQQIEDTITRKHDGTGLGLSISRKLAHLLGGEIEVESIWSKGSTFRLILPKEGATE